MSDRATVAGLLADARDRLRSGAVDASPREASLLLGHLLGRGEAWVLAFGDAPVSPSVASRLLALVDRRLRGEPVAYLLGRREFFGRCFVVDARALIPRPETEHVIESALTCLAKGPARVLDLGTGSGCIAVTLACEHPKLRVFAVDRSIAALALANLNVRRHDVSARVALVASDWAAALRLSAIDLVVANPPYIDLLDAATLPRDVAGFEPHMALFAGGGGLADLSRIFDLAPRLSTGTPLVVEIGAGQESVVERLARHRGWQVESVVEDYAGIARTVTLRRQ